MQRQISVKSADRLENRDHKWSFGSGLVEAPQFGKSSGIRSGTGGLKEVVKLFVRHIFYDGDLQRPERRPERGDTSGGMASSDDSVRGCSNATDFCR